MSQQLITLAPLPVQDLPAICAAYLKSVEPFLNETQYAHTRSLVAQFLAPGGHGEQLHRLLLLRQSLHVNWLEEWWLKLAYLSYRKPLVCHSNPSNTFGVLAHTKIDEHTQTRTGALVLSR